MKVALFSDTFPPERNGVATSCRSLYRTLRSHGDECYVITTNPEDTGIVREGEDGSIIRLPGLRLKWLYDYRAAFFYSPTVMKILQDWKPDVAHIQTDAGIGRFGFLAASKLGIPTVYTFHTMVEDYTYYVTKGVLDRAAKGIVRSYIRHMSLAADEFITPSEKIREYMRTIGVDAQVNIVPTGTDFSLYDPSSIPEKEVEELRERLGIPKDAFVFLFLGRVAKEKSVDLLLKGYAAFLALKGKKDTRFVIVGGGPALESLEEMAKPLGISGKVIFTGAVSPDVTPLYYQLGDVFLSASVTETQGLTFQEAVAARLILLARYDDALVETVKDGETGFFYVDEKDLARKMVGILALPEAKRKVMEEKALKVIEPYSLDAFHRNIRKVYERAIRKNW